LPALQPPKQHTGPLPQEAGIEPLANTYNPSNLEQTARALALQVCGVKGEVDVGKVTCVLARNVYFGEPLLRLSTLKGKRSGLQALDSELVEHLKRVVRDTLFPNLTQRQFVAEIEPKIESSLSGLCRRSRNAYPHV